MATPLLAAANAALPAGSSLAFLIPSQAGITLANIAAAYIDVTTQFWLGRMIVLLPEGAKSPRLRE